jgi:hypothetical protein
MAQFLDATRLSSLESQRRQKDMVSESRLRSKVRDIVNDNEHQSGGITINMGSGGKGNPFKEPVARKKPQYTEYQNSIKQCFFEGCTRMAKGEDQATFRGKMVKSRDIKTIVADKVNLEVENEWAILGLTILGKWLETKVIHEDVQREIV